MAGLINWLSKNTESIELGVVKSIEAKQVYNVSVAGVNRKVHNTLEVNLTIGDRVLVSKLQSGKRYIMNKTGFSGDYNNTITKEIYING